MPVSELAVYLLTGAAAGLLGGLLGIGGGLIIVPALASLLPLLGVAPEVTVHIAVGTSLATIVFTNSASAWAHHRRGAVRWHDARRLVAGIVPGALLGAMVAGQLPALWLARVFAAFAAVMGLYLLAGRRPKPQREVPAGPVLGAAGMAIGAVSAVVGIGGGSLTAPLLMWCNVRAQAAVATAAACGLPLALGGALGFVASGWGNPALPGGAVGYVYPPALLGIALASVGAAPLGARLAHALPAGTLRRVFGLAMLGIAAYMTQPF